MAGVAGHLMLAFIDFIILRATVVPFLFQFQLAILVRQVAEAHVHLSNGFGRAIGGADTLSTAVELDQQNHHRRLAS